MKILISGGGTGGHTYPALEIARAARDGGDQVVFFGSQRGMEGAAAEAAGIPFQAFPAEPALGWRGLFRLWRVIRPVKQAMRREAPDVVFATGGYAAAPVMAAARSLRIPYAIHEANSVPGRTNRMFAGRAFRITGPFRTTAETFAKRFARDGQPIRASLRAAATEPSINPDTILVVGGSQGSQYLNETVPEAAAMAGWQKVLHLTGPRHLETTQDRIAKLGLSPSYQLRAYLSADEMADAYRSARVVIGRSGGSCAEFALFGLPSVLVPLPTSADHHQFYNAIEFARMEAAEVLWAGGSQTAMPATDVDVKVGIPEHIVAAVARWDDEQSRSRAVQNLRDWDIPDATERILAGLRPGAVRP